MGLFSYPSDRRLRDITTRWSILESMQKEKADERTVGWVRFDERYRQAMREYIATVLRSIFHRTPEENDVDDILSEFVLESISKSWLDEVRQGEIHSFRGWLMNSLRCSLIGQLRKTYAKKRHPEGRAVHSLDAMTDQGLEVPVPDDAEAVLAFNEAWVSICIVGEALRRLCAESPPHAAVIADLLRKKGWPRKLEFPPPENSKLPTRQAARLMFSRIVMDRLRETVLRPEDVADELRALRPFLP